mmetsp:Transcript_17571/g.48587  ORF Transcript_17571/g.48587 Transcript_17571/m.48587 type:complete len:220 (+) Transcript_17571:7882-8541(+)
MHRAVELCRALVPTARLQAAQCEGGRAARSEEVPVAARFELAASGRASSSCPRVCRTVGPASSRLAGTAHLLLRPMCGSCHPRSRAAAARRFPRRWPGRTATRRTRTQCRGVRRLRCLPTTAPRRRVRTFGRRARRCSSCPRRLPRTRRCWRSWAAAPKALRPPLPRCARRWAATAIRTTRRAGIRFDTGAGPSDWPAPCRAPRRRPAAGRPPRCRVPW